MAKKKITKTTKNKMTKKTKKAIAKKKIPSATKVLAERLVLALIVILTLFLVYELFMMINPGDPADLVGKAIGEDCTVIPCTEGLYCHDFGDGIETCQECTTNLECGEGFECVEKEGIVGGVNNICIGADNLIGCEENLDPEGYVVTLTDLDPMILASYCLDILAHDLTTCVVESGVTYETADCSDPFTCYKGKCDMFINGPPSDGCDPSCVAPEICFQGTCINNNIDPNDGPVDPDGDCDPACVVPEVCFEGNCIDGGVFDLCDPECGADEICQGGACVPNEPVCDPLCENEQVCLNNACVDVSGLLIGQSQVFEFADGDCLKVTLDDIQDQGTENTLDDTYDFSISKCKPDVQLILERMDDATEAEEFTTDYGVELNIGDMVFDGVIMDGETINLPDGADEFLGNLESIHNGWINIPADVFETIDFEDPDGFDVSPYLLTLLHWPMNVQEETQDGGDTISITPNIGGEKHYGVVQGDYNPTPAEELVGKSFEFDGTTNSIESLLDYDFALPFSVEFFFMDGGEDDIPFFTLVLGEQLGISLGLNVANELTFKKKLSLEEEITTEIVGDLVFVDSWNHLVMVYDEPAMIFYLNGEKLTTESDVTMVDDFNGEYLPLDQDAVLNLLSVGYSEPDNLHFFGFMDEFKIYQRAISQEQIQLNFESVLEITTTDGVQPISVEDDASYYSFNKISVVENSGCGYWAVTAIAVDIGGEPMAAEDGNDMVFGVLAPVNSDFGDEVVEGYCGALTCVEGLCDTPVNCVDDSTCIDGSCVIDYELVDEVEKECTTIDNCTFLSGYECGTAANPVLDGKCFKGICVPSDPPEPDDVTPNTQYSPGGGSPGYKGNNCKVQDPEKCHAQKAYTSCVGGQILYTCMSTCGDSLLFMYDCEGNTPSFAPGCNNKIKDIGEDGIDCGGICPTKCPDHCFNSIKDSDETGIDCGGKKCKTCEKPAPVITPKPKPTPDLVIQKPSGLSKYWWTIIPFLVIIGLIVFLVVKGKKPVGSVEETMEVKETTSTPQLPKMTREEKSLHNDHMKSFVKKELGAGKSKSDIAKSLEKVGHKPEDINNVFETGEALPKGYEEQIRKYVTYYLDKGKSPAEIRKTLTKQGWSKEIIDMFLAR